MAVKEGYKNYSHALVDSDLDLLRKEKRFLTLMDTLQKRGDYVFILKTDHAYQKEDTTARPQFTYESADSRRLKTLKNHFKLDSIAGDGDEISQILNLLEWVHNAIRHNGSNWALCEFTAIDFYNYYKATGKGVNCRALAMSLNECYLAMGFASKYVTCLPKNGKDPDCHVINTVYSKTLQKWIWVDPTFNAYLKDENGTLLSIAEVRQRLIDNQPIILNDDANWNNEKPQTKKGYLDGYMAKNLYWIEVPEKSVFNSESRYRSTETKFVALFPLGYTREDIMKYATITHDPEYFWQAPSKNK